MKRFFAVIMAGLMCVCFAFDTVAEGQTAKLLYQFSFQIARKIARGFRSRQSHRSEV